MVDNKLKPCPFCGHESYTKPLKSLDGTGHVAITCLFCSAFVLGQTKEQAVARWNRRANDDV